ncbi:MAG: NAD(P)-dependent alcohol dehydrogenase [Williamsia sp.]|nr:NAD(P)-dependent alcohol dehydrogenase [Williamsia sp.]
MRKLIYNKYGDERVLELQEQPVPTIKENGLLIRVKAGSINPLDWKIYRGEMKLMSGSKFPKSVGIDFSGIVEKTGILVTRFKRGDEVFGLLNVFKGGALADYVAVDESNVSRKPGSLSFAQAAALPVTGLAALQIIDGLAAVGHNKDVLINGATGGVGMFAVQIAKRRDASITAVVSTEGIPLAAKWGAGTVVDYTKQDVRLAGKRYDAVIDLSGKLPFKAAKGLMKSKAVYISTLPSPVALISSFFNNLFSSQKQKILLLKPAQEGLDTLADLAEDKMEVLVDKVYSINNAREAYREASVAKIKGKSVIVLD